MGNKQYIVICQNIVGNPEAGYGTCYWGSGERHATRAQAKREGFRLRDSDDFNIGVIESGRLVSFDWMDEPLEYTAAEIEDISEQMGLETA